MHEMITGRMASIAANGENQRRSSSAQAASGNEDGFAKAFDGTGPRSDGDRRSRPDSDRPDPNLKWVKVKPILVANSQTMRPVQSETLPADAFVFEPDATPLDIPSAEPSDILTELPRTSLANGTEFPPLRAIYGGSAKETEFFGEYGEAEELSESVDDPTNTQDIDAALAGILLGQMPTPGTQIEQEIRHTVANAQEPVPEASVDQIEKSPGPIDGKQPALIFASRHGQKSAVEPQSGNSAATDVASAEKVLGNLTQPIGDIKDAPSTAAAQDGKFERDWNWFRSAMSDRAGPVANATASEFGQAVGQGQAAAALVAQAPDFQFVSQRSKAAQGPDIALTSGELVDGSLRPLAQPANSQAMIATPQTAQQVFAQIAVAVEQAKTNEIEIALDPEELGKVRILLAPKEGGYDITIIASREQTLDMMRRFGSDLSSSFAQMGYEHTDLNFESADQEGTSDDRPSRGEIGASEDLQEEHPSRVVIARGGLDLKL